MSKTITKYLEKLKRQTIYFKLAFGVTIIPVVAIVTWMIYGLVADMTSDQPDAGLALLTIPPYLIVGLFVYYAIMYACSRKSWVGKASSVVVLALAAFCLYVQILFLMHPSD